MSYSISEVTATGGNTFSIPFDYIAQSEIAVFVDGVSTSFTFTSANVIDITPAPTSGALVRIKRTTSLTDRTVDFQSGAVLTEEDLDNSNIQVFHAAQEAIDAASESISVGLDGKFDAQLDSVNRAIKNVADPTDAQDVVTKNWAETGMSSQLATATAKASEASTSASSASASETAAASSASTASTKASEASVSAANAAVSATNAAQSSVSAATSATNAATSATNASTSESNASSDATTASNAASTATSQASVASSAATTATSQATSATNSANAAASSESNASTSATNAATSATSASTSASQAQGYRDTTLGYKDSAAASATDALSSKNAAATSETNAAASESSAAADASTATTKASEAATSASNAATSATNAASSASAAAQSAIDAADAAGFDPADFIQTSGTQTRSGNLQLYSTDITGNYLNSPIEIREVNQVNTTQTAIAYAPAIAFLWGSTAQGQIALHSNGDFHFRDGAVHTNYRDVYVKSLVPTGTVDGRDVAADGAKLDGIEAGATADQTKADIDALGVDAATLGGYGWSNVATNIETTSHIISGAGSGGVSLTVNDGYGNANIAFNHFAGIPEQSGNAARIEVNTDNTVNASMNFEVKSGVTEGAATGLTTVLNLAEGQATVTGNTVVTGNIAVTGTVDGRDVAADGAKLDTVEYGATADQTKADIDALGVDAGTLDGLDSTAFGRLATASDWSRTQSYNRVTLTDAATINWNMATSPSAIVSLSANRTMGNPTNIKAGNWYTLRVYHSGAPRTLAWSSYWKFGGNGAPALSTVAGRYDVLTFYAHATTALTFVGITLHTVGA